MFTSLIMAATAVASSTSLIIEGVVTYTGIWAVCKGVKQTAKTHYTFKH